MSNTSVGLKNLSRPAPRWFRKFKKAAGILTLAANVMVAQWPTGNEELKARIQLWCTIGIGAILEALEAILANGEYYSEVKSANDQPA
jgi:hypothetical protein